MLLEGEGAVHCRIAHPERGVLFNGGLELAPEDPDAQQLMAELRENLLHLEKGKKKY